jgi:hypothetical protein
MSAATYTAAMVLGTSPDQMLSPQVGKMKVGMTTEELARMDCEMESLEQVFESIEANYTKNMMILTLGRGYIKR